MQSISNNFFVSPSHHFCRVKYCRGTHKSLWTHGRGGPMSCPPLSSREYLCFSFLPSGIYKHSQQINKAIDYSLYSALLVWKLAQRAKAAADCEPAASHLEAGGTERGGERQGDRTWEKARWVRERWQGNSAGMGSTHLCYVRVWRRARKDWLTGNRR